MERSRTSVFIVEDSTTIQEQLTQLLLDLKYVDVVGTTGQAQDAIEAIRELEPDLVTLDLRLKDGNGLDVLKAVKRQPKPPVVVVLTNFAEPPYRAYCRKFGADHFFDKTIDFPQVIDLISQLASSRPGKLAV